MESQLFLNHGFSFHAHHRKFPMVKRDMKSESFFQLNPIYTPTVVKELLQIA
jgi:hypothetical protein